MRKDKVVSRTKDGDSNEKGSFDSYPFLNTLTCDVEFPDVEIKEHVANVIAEKCLLKKIIMDIMCKSWIALLITGKKEMQWIKLTYVFEQRTDSSAFFTQFPFSLSSCFGRIEKKNIYR